ncbi:hypothetical protein [Bacillus horti]|uniref:Uncharacterized protein n=1 Tax=Caldalkalibacillus horti TaxID=77523 RepID=A0ABT9W0C7_9BACI|nr:hypothetical protein [Bacillus horti]MDQ0166677.1 hypothetical protein [Bacillus horti]
MYWFVLGGLIGVFLGAGLSRWLDEHQLFVKNRQKMKDFFSAFVVFVVFVYGAYLFLANLEHFSQFRTISSFEDLQSFIYSNPVIQQLIAFSVFAFLLSIISFIVRSPFFKWEQIKIFGFEAKAAIKEKAEKEAKEELDYLYLMENLRMDTMEIFTSDLTYDIIRQHLNLQEHVFNGKHALEEILESYCILYRESPLNGTIRYGVLTIHNHEISVADYEQYIKLPQYLKEDIDHVIQTKQVQRWYHDDIHTFITPFSFLNDYEVYYVIYLSSYEIEFNSLTEKQFQILKNIIELYIKESVKQNSYIVTHTLAVDSVSNTKEI